MAAPPAKVSATTEPAVEKAQPILKKDRGVVKSVLSGDTLVVLDDKPNPQGPPGEKIITLSSLSAPKMARGDSKEEPWAWESREFLRKKCVGKKVQFAIDHSTGTREYVTAYLPPVAAFEPECINHSVVSEGWASVHTKDAKRAEPLLQLQEVAVQARKGIHGDPPKPIGKNDEDADTLNRQLKGKPMTAIVEQVRTGSSVRVTVLPSRHQFQVLLSGVQSPGWRKKESDPSGEPQPEPFAREAKYFVENNVLQREVTLVIDGIASGPNEKQMSFYGSIEQNGHDVAEELLKAGLAKYVAHTASLRGKDEDGFAKLKKAEQIAKEKKLRLFANYEAPKPDSAGGKGLESEFTGKVVNIQNVGVIGVVPEGQTKEVLINISCIRTPKPGFPGDEEADTKLEKAQLLQVRAERYWAAEGKEQLRRRLIGQKVTVKYDYTRTGKKGEEGDKKALPDKNYYSVYQGEQNVAVTLVEAGFASVLQRQDERSQDYEVLCIAEKKAIEHKKGIHTPPEKVPTRRINDLCIDNDPEKRAAQIARTKPFLASFERAGPLKAIIDYVFSGARFKVTVPKQSCVFMFALSGIRVPKRDEGKEGDELSNAALQFSREKLHQIEVTIEIDGLDKGGNFVGSLHIGKKNYAVNLLESGLAYIHYASAERLKEFKELTDAETSAKNKRLGYWKNYDEEAEKAKLAASAAETGDIGPLQGKTIEVVVTEIVDGARMYIQVHGPESAGLDELVSQLTELSVSEGKMPPVTPKVGDLVRGLFPADNKWYRAKVVEVNGDKYKLFYVDYGNSEVVGADGIRSLPADSGIKALPAQAQLASLAFIKPLKEDSENARDAKDCLGELAGGRKLQATIEYKDANAVYMTLIDSADNLNVGLEMIQQGYARLERRSRRHQSNPNFIALKEAEEKAKQRRVGIWYYGDAPDSDEDERETPRKGAPPAGKGGKPAKGEAAAPATGGKKK